MNLIRILLIHIHIVYILFGRTLRKFCMKKSNQFTVQCLTVIIADTHTFRLLIKSSKVFNVILSALIKPEFSEFVLRVRCIT